MKINILEQDLSLFKIWIFSFLYTGMVSASIQLVILPYIFPSLHYGDGLLNGALDSIGLHMAGIELAEKIRKEGWHAWELLYHNNPTSGIVGAVYALSFPKPWTLIPINSALHATSTLLLFLVVNNLIDSKKKALLCVLPFLFYPTAMTWYTQILKDGFAIAGTFFLIYGILLLTKNDFKGKICIAFFIFVTLGIVVVFIMRPYLVTVTKFIYLSNAVFLVLFSLKKIQKKQAPYKQELLRLFAIGIIFFVIYPYTTVAIKEILNDSNSRNIIREVNLGENLSLLSKNTDKPSSGTPDETLSKNTDKPSSGTPDETLSKNTDKPSSGTPESTDKTLPMIFSTNPYKNKYIASLLRSRQGFSSSGGKTLVDKDVIFNDIFDFIKYLPRLFEISFFSPFPSQWFGEGSFPANTLQRRIVGIEMIGVYFSYIFLPYAFYKWRKRIEFWSILSFCSSITLLMGFIVLNVGTLHRLRYGFLMPIVTLGIAGFIMARDDFLNKKTLKRLIRTD